ncbi:DUF2971 domain-containing protein [Aeromonas rivipollensis]|uniref:DUF2971 domain-containing protein n=1 Tax=Aeromonas rivipollensis TaxID=948519 RepID=UPI003D200B41
MLFKYLAPERIDVLEFNNIRFTQPAEFNDPFELKPVISTLASRDEMDRMMSQEMEYTIQNELEKLPPEIRKLIPKTQLEALIRNKYSEHWPEIEEQFKSIGVSLAQTFVEKSNELIGVLSLTENYSNLLMWSHYASSHKGFCIGFDENNHFFNRKRSHADEFYHLRKVEYVEDRPTSRVTQITGTELFLVKSNHWFYEQEWRICALLNDANITIESNPYPIHLFSFPRSAVKEVILGACMENETKQRLLNVINSKYEHVIVRQSKISPGEFKVTFD